MSRIRAFRGTAHNAMPSRQVPHEHASVTLHMERRRERISDTVAVTLWQRQHLQAARRILCTCPSPHSSPPVCRAAASTDPASVSLFAATAACPGIFLWAAASPHAYILSSAPSRHHESQGSTHYWRPGRQRRAAPGESARGASGTAPLAPRLTESARRALSLGSVSTYERRAALAACADAGRS